MAVLLIVIVLLYTVYLLVCLKGWLKTPFTEVPVAHQPKTKLSVIIAVRNEAENIQNLLKDLAQQTYPESLFEVIIIDDSSDDVTASLVKDFIEKAFYPLHYIYLPDVSQKSGKKAAVQAGIDRASGELLLFTDGDCRVQPNWLICFEYKYSTTQARFISGPVFFQEPVSLFEKLQVVEFAALIGVGAASIANKMPTMCNGANIAYPKAVFAEVNGFEGNEQIASGDDEFLLHKVHSRYPGSVAFLKAPKAVVYTPAKKEVTDFFAQRVRWGSKWPAYKSWTPKLIALLVFGVNFLLLFCLVLWVGGVLSGGWLFCGFILKIGVDLLFLHKVLLFFHKQKYWVYIIPLQIVYVPYVILTALFALRGNYSWKGRIIKN
ncbi:glycosyltransferase [Adhaeribacter aquaticus]|uniref:glycosyltransferase n=1 Tax=Adhaeribacter aquaticus TaxID=299567 RepID=UPI00047BFCCD|nr:glycosyltransferase [Adhaeribacter aquaticus]